MHRHWLHVLLPLIPLSGVAAAAFTATTPLSTDFESNFETAIETGLTEEGAAYDTALAQYFFTLPELTSGLTSCVEASTSSLKVWGYFYFDASGGYRLFLRPENAFSKCLVALFDAKSPPSPPRRPYINPFSFGVDPDSPYPQPPRI
jgi:hypothetical protein